jgi:hypothetical protein
MTFRKYGAGLILVGVLAVAATAGGPAFAQECEPEGPHSCYIFYNCPRSAGCQGNGATHEGECGIQCWAYVDPPGCPETYEVVAAGSAYCGGIPT